MMLGFKVFGVISQSKQKMCLLRSSALDTKHFIVH